MSEDVKKKEDVELDTDPAIEPEFEIDDELNWDGLPQFKKEVVQELLKQQAFILELSKVYKKQLEANPSTYKFVEGLMLSLKDLAMQLAELDGAINNRTGVVDNVDDKLEYLNIATAYINIQESITSLVSNGYLEIVSSLNLNVDKLKETITQGKEDIKNAGK